MTYVKTNWKTGDTITADKLNNIEDGIASSGGGGGGATVITAPEDATEVGLDMTFEEMKDAVLNGNIPSFIIIEHGTYEGEEYETLSYIYPSRVDITETQYNITIMTNNRFQVVSSSDPDDEIVYSLTVK